MLYGILDKERNRSLAVAVARRRGAEQLFKGPCISLMAFIVRIQGDVKNVGIRFNQRFPRLPSSVRPVHIPPASYKEAP